jgi:hypothetical protein
MRLPPTNDNMCNEFGNAIKPEFIQDYNRCMGYVHLRGQDDKQLLDTKPDIEVDNKFSYCLCMTALNDFLLLTVCGTKMTHGDFQLCLVQNLMQGLTHINPWAGPVFYRNRLYCLK